MSFKSIKTYLSKCESRNNIQGKETSPTQVPKSNLSEHHSNLQDTDYDAGNYASCSTAISSSRPICHITPVLAEKFTILQDLCKSVSNIRIHRPRQKQVLHPKDGPESKIERSSAVKRLRRFDSEEEIVPVPQLQQSQVSSKSHEAILDAVQRSCTEPDLIGDFSKSFALPLVVDSRHQDVKAIHPKTLARLLNGVFQDVIESYTIIDSRYPYEFEAGHIAGAVNIYTQEQCLEVLNDIKITAEHSKKRQILVFYCECSVERGPNLCRFLRKQDRSKNESIYPCLDFPEIYLLGGGYNGFFLEFSQLCTPIGYVSMNHPDHKEALKRFRQKEITWNRDLRFNGRNLKRRKF